MNMESIQAAVVSLLQASALLSGIEVLADDGSYPQTPEREELLIEDGRCIIVSQIVSLGVIEVTQPYTGAVRQNVGIHVIIEENPTKNRATPGRPTCDAMARIVIESLLGQPVGSPLPYQFSLQETPWENYGRPDGVSRIVVNLQIPNYLSR